MKIAFLMQEGAPDVRVRPLPGPANHVYQVFRGLQQRGHQVEMLARYNGVIWYSPDLDRFERVHVAGVDDGIRRRLESLARGIQSRLHLPYLNRFESLRFAAACKQHFTGYDVFFERMGWMGYGGSLASQQMKIPLILEANNGDFITELERLGVAPQGFQRKLAIDLMRKAVHRATHVVATGEGHRKRFIEWWQYPSSSVSTVENGSEIVDLLSRDRLPVFQHEHNPRQSDQINIVFVGAFEPWHGIEVLINALPRVVREHPSIKLTLVGGGTQEKQIRQKINELDLESNVHMAGRVNIGAVADHLLHADIGAAPYCGWMEFSGLKLFDYKAAGLAIVASGQNGQPATLSHGKTALIVPPCDVDALSEAILHLIHNPELRWKIGRAARIEAEEQHSWRHTVAELEKIITGVKGQ